MGQRIKSNCLIIFRPANNRNQPSEKSRNKGLVNVENGSAKEETINEHNNKKVLETPRGEIQKLNDDKKIITPQTNIGSPSGEVSTSNINIEERRDVNGKKLDYEIKKPMKQFIDTRSENEKAKNESIVEVKDKPINVSDIPLYNKEQHPPIEINKDQKPNDINISVEIVEIVEISNKAHTYCARVNDTVSLNEPQTSRERTRFLSFPPTPTDKQPPNHKDKNTQNNPTLDKPNLINAVEKKDIALPKEEKKIEDQVNNKDKLEDSKCIKSDKQSNSGIHIEEEIREINDKPFSTIKDYKIQDKVITDKADDLPLSFLQNSPKSSIQSIPKIKPINSHRASTKTAVASDKKLKLHTNLLEESLILDTSHAQGGHKSDKILSDNIMQFLQADFNDDMDNRSVKDTHTLPRTISIQDFNAESPDKNINSPNNLLSTTDLDNIEESLLVI